MLSWCVACMPAPCTNRVYPFDAFAQSASRRYQLPEPVNSAMRGESTTFFVQRLFPEVIFSEASLAGESRLHNIYRRRRLSIGISVMAAAGIALIAGWHHFYRVNEEAGRNVLTKAQAFIGTNELEGQPGYGFQQLPRLNRAGIQCGACLRDDVICKMHNRP